MFSPEPLRHLNNVANALFLGVLADFVMQAPITFCYSWISRTASPLHFAQLRIERCGVVLFLAGTVLGLAGDG